MNSSNTEYYVTLWKELFTLHSMIHPHYCTIHSATLQIKQSSHRKQTYGASFSATIHSTEIEYWFAGMEGYQLRAATHSIPSATMLTASFQKPHMPEFSNLDKNLRDTVQPIPQNMPGAVVFLACLHLRTHKIQTCD